ncbi:mechanosensitive ion channel family protein [Candidatus Izemoplasma sp. B36]|uniref:mechanosensitive ion channel family protein n=1 Tax=Candidatus Izemoplasma sp. B36 TaxID=3242468 RepID=UPI003556A3ED
MNLSRRKVSFLEKVKRTVVSLAIIACFFFGIFASRIFPNTEFANIIDTTVGKFFDIVDFFTVYYKNIIETFTVILFIWLIYKVLGIFTNFIVKIRRRSGTVIALIMNALKYISLIVAFFLILSTWGVETTTLLASAGIIALALSLGAQSLIADILAGVFIIFENQFKIGDVIQINDFRGIVKSIGIRITKFEDINGDIKIINNSDIRGAINSSNLLSQAICYIDISYEQDIDKFETMMRKNMSKMKEAIPLIKKGPFYDGIEKFQESGMTIRVVSWVNEIDRLHIVRQMNKYLKKLFDKKNIQIPYPQVIVHNPQAKRASVKKTSATKKKTITKAASTTKKGPVAKKTTTKKATTPKKTTTSSKGKKSTTTSKTKKTK